MTIIAINNLKLKNISKIAEEHSPDMIFFVHSPLLTIEAQKIDGYHWVFHKAFHPGQLDPDTAENYTALAGLFIADGITITEEIRRRISVVRDRYYAGSAQGVYLRADNIPLPYIENDKINDAKRKLYADDAQTDVLSKLNVPALFFGLYDDMPIPIKEILSVPKARKSDRFAIFASDPLVDKGVEAAELENGVYKITLNRR